MKKIFLLLLFISTFFILHAEDNLLVSRKDFDISERWQLKKIMGRDFWNMFFASKYNPKAKKLRNILYFPTSQLPPEMKKYLDIPAFTEVALIPGSLTKKYLRKNSDGTVTLIPPDFSDWIPADRPYWLRNVYFTRLFLRFAHLRFLTKYKPDWEIYKAYGKKHPNFIGFYSLSEWGNNMNMLFMWLRNRYIKNKHLTPKQVEEIAKVYEENPKSRRDYVEHRLKPDFDHAYNVGYGNIIAMDGAWNIAHLAAYWGAKFISVETSRVYMNWHLQLMNARGAARQFGIPWGWYAASHATICNEKGISIGKGAEPYAWVRGAHSGPDCGASLNSRMRVSYFAYLAGANTYQRETAEGNYWDYTAKGEERWKLAPEGKMYVDFFNFTKKHADRGVPYTPIALLVAHDRGMYRNPGKAFWRYDYTHGDNMVDAFTCTMFPPFSSAKMYQKGIEITQRDLRYGDIFDMLTPDFEDSTKFAEILPAYKVAILLGEYSPNKGMVKAMVDYVHKGGTLVINSKHLDLGFTADFTGVKADGEFKDDNGTCTLLKTLCAKSILKDSKGRPLFTRNVFGKGAVIVGARHFLAKDFQAAEANTVLAKTISGQRNFPDVKWLLDKLAPEVVPAKVEGEVQYGFNRTKDGWWIYLFNNHGVRKTALTPQKIDVSAETKAKIDLTRMNPLSVTELFTGKKYNGKIIEVPVEAASCRILKIITK